MTIDDGLRSEQAQVEQRPDTQTYAKRRKEKGPVEQDHHQGNYRHDFLGAHTQTAGEYSDPAPGQRALLPGAECGIDGEQRQEAAQATPPADPGTSHSVCSG